MKLSLSAIIFGLALLVAGCSTTRHDASEIFGGPGSTRVLELPDAVRAWRLDSSYAGAQPCEAEPDGYPALDGPVAVDGWEGQRLGGLLAQPGSYSWGGAAKACLPRYGVRLEFERDGSTLDALLCFGCELLLAYKDRAYAGAGDFRPARGELARSMLELFPEFEELEQFLAPGE